MCFMMNSLFLERKFEFFVCSYGFVGVFLEGLMIVVLKVCLVVLGFC